MSELPPGPEMQPLGGRSSVPAGPVRQVMPGREVLLGGSTVVRRVLPNLDRRLVGPWCFVDHYGPDDITVGAGMSVPPHPHIGLQTVSWLLEGQVHHQDSIGSDQLVLPGSLGLMTAGRGIAHAEHSPQPHPTTLHGVQLWVALPDAARCVDPAWQHHSSLPVVEQTGVTATVIMGELAGATSPGQVFSPIVGVDVALEAGANAILPLEHDFEHAVMMMSGAAEVDAVPLAPGSMIYLGSGRRDLRLRADVPARLLLLGGLPFDEEIVMWWNFVARTGEEIAGAHARWSREGFGRVPDAGEPTPAPQLPAGRLKPAGSVRR
jgi:quercetin 2,3-dioxygenase